MRLAVLVYLTLATLMLSAEDRVFSHNRDLPPLKFAATDLDAILLKTHALIAAANGFLAATLVGIPLSYFLPQWQNAITFNEVVQTRQAD